MTTRLDFELILETLKPYLPQYLESQGVKVDKKGMFACINPDHMDKNPSCGLIANAQNKLFHCFSCLTSGNIFLAAHYLEGKPLAGRGFISDNVLPLAQRFGIDIPKLELTDEQLKEIETYRAYNDACLIVKNSEFSEAVKAKLGDLGWTRDTRLRLGIGSVTAFPDYMRKMTTHYGHKPEFLKEIDLDNPYIFDPQKLIYTFRDENGAPIGFAARDLNYEAKQEAYLADVAEIENDSARSREQKDQAISILRKPRKYMNTSSAVRIFEKGKTLYNFSEARKYAPPLYIFEGQPDVATLFQAGQRNVCCVGSNSFTREHLKMIVASGIKHIIFVLDADNAGEAGTDRFVQLLEEEIGGRVGLRAEIILMPEGSDDPDKYIRSFGYATGLKQFKQLPVIDIFSWKLRKMVRDGRDPLTLAQETIPLIVNEPNYLVRMSMSQKLSDQTGVLRDAIWNEVCRQSDNDQVKIDAEKGAIAKRLAKELEKHPEQAQAILETGRYELEEAAKTRMGYDLANVVRAIRDTMERASTPGSRRRLVTGWKLMDAAFDGGFPAQIFLTVPGKPNQGKTTLLDNLVINMLDHNPDLIVIYHSVDDALAARISRMQAARFRIPSKYFFQAGDYLDNPPPQFADFPTIFSQADHWITSLVEQERLILVDVNGLSKNLYSLQAWVRQLRRRYPDKQMLVIGDNFHLYKIPHGPQDEQAKVREMSEFIKTMANENMATCMFTMELPKESLRPGVRPRVGKIKGSAGMAYDSNGNLGVYNDIKDMGDKAELYWTDPTDMERRVSEEGIELIVPKRKPIVEIVIDKSKISSFDGSIFYRLDPVTGYMEECSEAEQTIMAQKASTSAGRKLESTASMAPYQSSI